MNSSPKRTSLLEPLAGGMLVLVALLHLRRYMGINHDAALYLGQALLERWPDIFRHDLFFFHGSQGRYTLMPWLINRFFDLTTPGTVFLIGTLAGLLAFAAAAWYFLKSALLSRQRYWALLAALCLPSAYGVVSIFSYGEPFLTSRPFAEALCLLGLGCLSRKRLILGVAVVGAAGLLHPLQAVAACLVAWPWLILQDRRWLHALWLALLVILLGFSDIAPFRDLITPIDAIWLADVREFTGQLFLSTWNSADFISLAFDVFVLAFAWRRLEGQFGRWCLSALIGIAIGFTFTSIFVDWLHLKLPTELQLWRVQWLAHFIAISGFGALLFRDFGHREPARALCLAISLLLVHDASWAWLLPALLYISWDRLLGSASTSTKRTLAALFLLGMLVLFAIYAANEWLLFRMNHYHLELYPIDRRLLIYPLAALGLPLLGVCLWQRFSTRGKLLLFSLVLIPLLAFGAVRWDDRSPMALEIESHPFRPDLFGPTLASDAQVLWIGDRYPSVWLALQRADFFSIRQLAGTIFNRGTAMEARRRFDRVLTAMREDLYCQRLPSQRRASCQLDEVAMRTACNPGSTRRPDYIVLPYRQPQRAAGHWDFIDPTTGRSSITYWLYSCDQVMQDLESPARSANPP